MENKFNMKWKNEEYWKKNSSVLIQKCNIQLYWTGANQQTNYNG